MAQDGTSSQPAPKKRSRVLAQAQHEGTSIPAASVKIPQKAFKPSRRAVEPAPNRQQSLYVDSASASDQSPSPDKAMPFEDQSSSSASGARSSTAWPAGRQQLGPSRAAGVAYPKLISGVAEEPRRDVPRGLDGVVAAARNAMDVTALNFEDDQDVRKEFDDLGEDSWLGSLDLLDSSAALDGALAAADAELGIQRVENDLDGALAAADAELGIQSFGEQEVTRRAQELEKRIERKIKETKEKQYLADQQASDVRAQLDLLRVDKDERERQLRQEVEEARDAMLRLEAQAKQRTRILREGRERADKAALAARAQSNEAVRNRDLASRQHRDRMRQVRKGVEKISEADERLADRCRRLGAQYQEKEEAIVCQKLELQYLSDEALDSESIAVELATKTKVSAKEAEEACVRLRDAEDQLGSLRGAEAAREYVLRDEFAHLTSCEQSVIRALQNLESEHVSSRTIEAELAQQRDVAATAESSWRNALAEGKTALQTVTTATISKTVASQIKEAADALNREQREESAEVDAESVALDQILRSENAILEAMQDAETREAAFESEAAHLAQLNHRVQAEATQARLALQGAFASARGEVQDVPVSLQDTLVKLRRKAEDLRERRDQLAAEAAALSDAQDLPMAALAAEAIAAVFNVGLGKGERQARQRDCLAERDISSIYDSLSKACQVSRGELEGFLEVLKNRQKNTSDDVSPIPPTASTPEASRFIPQDVENELQEAQQQHDATLRALKAAQLSFVADTELLLWDLRVAAEEICLSAENERLCEAAILAELHEAHLWPSSQGASAQLSNAAGFANGGAVSRGAPLGLSAGERYNWHLSLGKAAHRHRDALVSVLRGSTSSQSPRSLAKLIGHTELELQAKIEKGAELKAWLSREEDDAKAACETALAAANSVPWLRATGSNPVPIALQGNSQLEEALDASLKGQKGFEARSAMLVTELSEVRQSAEKWKAAQASAQAQHESAQDLTKASLTGEQVEEFEKAQKACQQLENVRASTLALSALSATAREECAQVRVAVETEAEALQRLRLRLEALSAADGDMQRLYCHQGIRAEEVLANCAAEQAAVNEIREELSGQCIQMQKIENQIPGENEALNQSRAQGAQLTAECNSFRSEVACRQRHCSEMLAEIATLKAEVATEERLRSAAEDILWSEVQERRSLGADLGAARAEEEALRFAQAREAENAQVLNARLSAGGDLWENSRSAQQEGVSSAEPENDPQQQAMQIEVSVLKEELMKLTSREHAARDELRQAEIMHVRLRQRVQACAENLQVEALQQESEALAIEERRLEQTLRITQSTGVEACNKALDGNNNLASLPSVVMDLHLRRERAEEVLQRTMMSVTQLAEKLGEEQARKDREFQVFFEAAQRRSILREELQKLENDDAVKAGALAEIRSEAAGLGVARAAVQRELAAAQADLAAAQAQRGARLGREQSLRRVLGSLEQRQNGRNLQMMDILATGAAASAAATTATAQGSMLRTETQALSMEVNELSSSVANERTAQAERLKALAGALEEEGRLEMHAEKIQTQSEQRLDKLSSELREVEGLVTIAATDRQELTQRLDQLHSELRSAELDHEEIRSALVGEKARRSALSGSPKAGELEHLRGRRARTESQEDMIKEEIRTERTKAEELRQAIDRRLAGRLAEAIAHGSEKDTGMPFVRSLEEMREIRKQQQGDLAELRAQVQNRQHDMARRSAGLAAEKVELQCRLAREREEWVAERQRLQQRIEFGQRERDRLEQNLQREINRLMGTQKPSNDQVALQMNSVMHETHIFLCKQQERLEEATAERDELQAELLTAVTRLEEQPGLAAIA